MRIKPDDLMSLRRTRKEAIFITGGNGFVGSHLVAALYRAGYFLKVLCRGKKDVSAFKRMEKVLSWHNIAIDNRIEIIEGDVCSPLFGLDRATFMQLALSVTEVVHCASNTSFSAEKKFEIESVNLEGTRNCIDLSLAGTCVHFHHISTAYVAGKGSDGCHEEITAPKDFHNPYESSKNEAENIVVNRCQGAGIGWSIYRPSIIIGDSVSGRTLIFNAMYYPVKVIDYLQGLFRKDFSEKGGQQAKKMGVQLQPDNTLIMPIRIDRGNADGGVINLVTIDHIVHAFMALFQVDSLGGIYQLVNKRPCTLDTLTMYTERYFDIRGITPLSTDSFKTVSKTVLERRFDDFTRIYLPYMADSRRFTTARADAFLNGRGITCPEIDYAIFKKCIDYAVKNQWESPAKRMENADANLQNSRLNQRIIKQIFVPVMNDE